MEWGLTMILEWVLDQGWDLGQVEWVLDQVEWDQDQVEWDQDLGGWVPQVHIGTHSTMDHHVQIWVPQWDLINQDLRPHT